MMQRTLWEVGRYLQENKSCRSSIEETVHIESRLRKTILDVVTMFADTYLLWWIMCKYRATTSLSTKSTESTYMLVIACCAESYGMLSAAERLASVLSSWIQRIDPWRTVIFSAVHFERNMFTLYMLHHVLHHVIMVFHQEMHIELVASFLSSKIGNALTLQCASRAVRWSGNETDRRSPCRCPPSHSTPTGHGALLAPVTVSRWKRADSNDHHWNSWPLWGMKIERSIPGESKKWLSDFKGT